MRIAVATQDCTRVDAHFGWAAHFMLFDVTPEGARFLRLVRFRGPLRADGDSAKLTPKLRALRGCRMVLASDIGLEARARLRRLDVEPITALAGVPVEAALTSLRDTLRRRPAPWLRRALQTDRRSARRTSP